MADNSFSILNVHCLVLGSGFILVRPVHYWVIGLLRTRARTVKETDPIPKFLLRLRTQKWWLVDKSCHATLLQMLFS